MSAVAHAELTEGVPCMLDMIPAQSAFARRRRVDLFHCAQTSRRKDRLALCSHVPFLARALELDDDQ